MARLVARALHAGQRVAVEAPTGTGKTLAYLTPGVAWAKAVQEPVVVATHSKVLQSQLLSAIKDYSESVGPIDWVLLKGTENYVSLENLDSALEAGPADQLEALALAVIAGWACVTPTGDWDDLNAWQLEDRLPGFSALCWTLSVDTEPSTPRSRLEELCFHRRAAEHLEVADIGILNHAVLVSRTSIRDMVESVVVDEAHNLEEAATSALSSSLDEHDLKRLRRYPRSRQTMGNPRPLHQGDRFSKRRRPRRTSPRRTRADIARHRLPRATDRRIHPQPNASKDLRGRAVRSLVPRAARNGHRPGGLSRGNRRRAVAVRSPCRTCRCAPRASSP